MSELASIARNGIPMEAASIGGAQQLGKSAAGGAAPTRGHKSAKRGRGELDTGLDKLGQMPIRSNSVAAQQPSNNVLIQDHQITSARRDME